MSPAQPSPTLLRLHAETAADLMVLDPISLRASATMEEAMILFLEKGIAAAPVIDEAGRPIGVISRSDLFIHQVEALRRQKAETLAQPTVADGMTPAVFAVAPHTDIARVVSDMVGLHVHRLFVVDDNGLLVGVITAMDVLKCIKP